MERAGGIAVGLERLGLRPAGVPVSEQALGARVGAWLWAGGAALILLSSFLPGSDRQLPLVPLTAAALALAAVNLLVYERRADWIVHALLGAGTVVVSSLVHWGGHDAQLYALLYLWVGLYAAYFLDLRPALLHLGGISLAYGLVVLDDLDWASLQAWLLRTGTLTGAVLLVLLLKGRLARGTAELERSVSLQRATLESTADGILVVDSDGRVAGFNRKFCELWAIDGVGDRGELLARAAAQVADPEAFLARAHELFADREACAEDTIELADGRVYERWTQPQRLGGETVGRVWSFRDVTARRAAEQALERSREALLQSQKMEAVGRLAGGIAHDFNNLLTAIGGYAELLQASLPEADPLRRDVGEIRAASDRAAALTRQLLAFSRRQVLRPAPLHLDDVVAGVHTMLRRLIGEDVELVAVPTPGLWTVSADPGQVEQVLVNLAVNARDAMPSGGRLTLETANVALSPPELRGTALAPGEYVRLTVTDTGVGMEPEVLERVFEPFFTTKEQGKGTGLGLATVHGIVRQSGGEVTVYSEPGVGTAVKVYLPRATAGAAAEPAPPPPPQAPGGSETILLVEDEESVRALAARVLELAGYRVLVAEDGEAALAVSAAHDARIDLVVTDVVMPRLGGRQLADRLAAARPDARVLFMSGYTGEAVERHGTLEPGAHFLGKPFAPDALARKVREVLDA